MRQERTFLTHPNGSEEIYNLQVVKESELPDFFSPFKLDTDNDWKDVARRWLYFNATHLSEERIEKIVQTHNEDHERILERGHFHGYTQIVHPPRVDKEPLLLDEVNELYGYGVYNVRANCFVDLPVELSGRASTPDHVTKEKPGQLLNRVASDHGLDTTNHLRIVEIRLANELDKEADEQVDL